jgi:hypothetical protein
VEQNVSQSSLAGGVGDTPARADLVSGAAGPPALVVDVDDDDLDDAAWYELAPMLLTPNAAQR